MRRPLANLDRVSPTEAGAAEVVVPEAGGFRELTHGGARHDSVMLRPLGSVTCPLPPVPSFHTHLFHVLIEDVEDAVIGPFSPVSTDVVIPRAPGHCGERGQADMTLIPSAEVIGCDLWCGHHTDSCQNSLLASPSR